MNEHTQMKKLEAFYKGVQNGAQFPAQEQTAQEELETLTTTADYNLGLEFRQRREDYNRHMHTGEILAQISDENLTTEQLKLFSDEFNNAMLYANEENKKMFELLSDLPFAQEILQQNLYGQCERNEDTMAELKEEFEKKIKRYEV